jgi:hypothetical protein
MSESRVRAELDAKCEHVGKKNHLFFNDLINKYKIKQFQPNHLFIQSLTENVRISH